MLFVFQPISSHGESHKNNAGHLLHLASYNHDCKEQYQLDRKIDNPKVATPVVCVFRILELWLIVGFFPPQFFLASRFWLVFYSWENYPWSIRITPSPVLALVFIRLLHGRPIQALCFTHHVPARRVAPAAPVREYFGWCDILESSESWALYDSLPTTRTDGSAHDSSDDRTMII